MTKKREKKPSFKEGQYVVYPVHGLGKFNGIVVKNVCDQEVELLEFSFEGTSFLVPIASCDEFGIRNPETPEMIKKALSTLESSQFIHSQNNLSKKMAECSARINSGSIVDLAIAIRETYVGLNSQNNISFTQKNLHNDAVEKFAKEISVVLNCNITEAYRMINESLLKNSKNVKTVATKDDFDDIMYDVQSSKTKLSDKIDSDDFDEEDEEPKTKGKKVA